jgi:hypothetical protein
MYHVSINKRKKKVKITCGKMIGLESERLQVWASLESSEKLNVIIFISILWIFKVFLILNGPPSPHLNFSYKKKIKITFPTIV